MIEMGPKKDWLLFFFFSSVLRLNRIQSLLVYKIIHTYFEYDNLGKPDTALFWFIIFSEAFDG